MFLLSSRGRLGRGRKPAIGKSATDGRENLNSSGDRILRGGSWNNKASLLRSADRAWNDPNAALFDYGFRCAKDAD
ncbi:MAG: SUMF1/EgtB/PvdO family nonheme iron enzyme [Bacteroidota bacterium]